jgi:hypothetical protein
MKKSVVTMYSFLVIVALVLLAGWLGYTYYTDSTGSVNDFQEEVPQLNKSISDLLLETENPGSSRFQQSMEDFLKGKPQIKGVLIYSGEDKLYYTRLESRNNRLMENLQKNEQFLLNKLNDGTYRAPFGIAHEESPLISLKGTPMSISYLHETFSPVKVYDLLLKALYLISGLFILTLILLIASSVKERNKGVEKNDDFFEPPLSEPSQVSIPVGEDGGSEDSDLDAISSDLPSSSLDDLDGFDDMDFDAGESAPGDLSDMDFGLPDDTADLGDLSVLDEIDLSDDEMMLPGEKDDFDLGGDSGLDDPDVLDMPDEGDGVLNLDLGDDADDLESSDIPDEADVLEDLGDLDLPEESGGPEDLDPDEGMDSLDDLELPGDSDGLEDFDLDDDSDSLEDLGDLDLPEESGGPEDLDPEEGMDSLDELELPGDGDGLEDFDLDDDSDSLELPEGDDDNPDEFDIEESFDDGGDLFGDLPDEEGDLFDEPAIEENLDDEDPKLYSPRSHVCWESFLNDRLPQELDRASSENEDLSFVYLRDNSVQSDEDYLGFSESLTKDFPYRDMIFEWGDQGFAMILPNSDLVETLEKLDVFINDLPERDIRIGITSRNGRLLDKDQLIGEASAAIRRTSHDNKIVGFRADPERYRDALSNA